MPAADVDRAPVVRAPIVRAPAARAPKERRFRLVRQDDPHFRQTIGQFISDAPPGADAAPETAEGPSPEPRAADDRTA
ncbi:MAG: hypothetical protein EPN50_02640 [Chloroflexota bacterium]|nr:MAG: hypothetical protein EPN50_02640 [Chloroflexota bacterium]